MTLDDLVKYLDDEAAQEKKSNETYPLPDTFTSEVMTKISLRKAGLSQQRNRGTMLRKIIVTAAGLFVAISLGTVVSPAFAEYISSLFKNGSYVDKGLQTAAENGHVNDAVTEVTDQGITLRVKEVMADPMRLAFIYEILKDGKPTDIDINWLHPQENTRIYVSDEAGNIIRDRFFTVVNADAERNGKLMQINLNEFGKVKEIASKPILHMEVSQIGTVSGKWNLAVPIDLEKSKAVSKAYEINQSFTSTDGRIIELKQLEFTPSGTRLIYDTRLTEESQKRWKAHLKQMADNHDRRLETYEPSFPIFAYQIVDDTDRVVADVFKDIIRPSISGEKGEEFGASKNQDTFPPFSDQQNLFFVLKSIQVGDEVEEVNWKVQILQKKH